MENNRKVSVIIPTYNCGEFIEEAIESVLNQTYKNVEVIVIDDGSTDNTFNLLNKKYSKLGLIKKTNGGPASARNLGLKHATGEFIAFLDADDLWSKNKIELQVKYFDRNNNYDLVYTDVQTFTKVKNNNLNKESILRCDLQGNLFSNLFWSNFIVNSSVMFRSSLIKSVGLLDESKNLIGSEDYEYWLRISMKSKIGVINKVLTYYRMHKNNLIGSSYKKAFQLHINIYKKFYKNYNNLSKLYGMNEKDALSDLILRYIYKNLSDMESFEVIFPKFIQSFFISPFKTLKALHLILNRNTTSEEWGNILSNYALWRNIVGYRW